MKKQEFLDLLRHYLRSLPTTVVEDIIADYEEHFEFGYEKNKTEEQICTELGSPRDIADDYLKNERYKMKRIGSGIFIDETKDTGEQKDGESWKKITLVVILCLLAMPIFGIGIGFLGGLVGLIIGMSALVFSFILAAVLLPLTLIPGFALPWFVSVPGFVLGLHPVTRVLFTLASFTFGIMGIALIVNFIRWIVKCIVQLYISIMWRINKKRGMR
ncbi:MAG: DUF1700 domain-containing protein [Filifactor alocis]|nr:DUF1700 domain-containing protein [Filifactor alocis]